MKMNKKTSIIIAAVVVALALVITGTVFLVKNYFGDDSDDVTTIEIGSVSASVGDTIKVPVSYKGNPGTYAMLIELQYNTEKLEYVSYEKGALFSDTEAAENSGIIRLIALDEQDVTEDGEIAYIQFEVLGGSGESTDITLNIEESTVCNFDEEYIEFEVGNGKVEIK